MSETQELITSFVRTGSETAFRELVTRYIDLVYSTAVRLVDGDTHRAEDVSQVVFADLARMAGTLSGGTSLGGWLHRHTCFVARNTMRGERRRLARERQAAEMNALELEGKSPLAEASPVVDEVINELAPDDREAIVLRFFERRNLRSVGEALGINENVAQKRVARAVEELGRLLQSRGIAFSAAALASGLAGAVNAAPAGLAASIAGKVLAGAAATGGAGMTAGKLGIAAKLKLGVASAVVLGGLVTSVVLWNQFRPSSAPNQAPRHQSAELPPPEPTSLDPVTEQVAAAVRDPSRAAMPFQNTAAAAGQPANPSVPALFGQPPSPFLSPALPPRAGVPVARFSAMPGSKVRIVIAANIVGTNVAVEGKIIGGFAEFGPDFPRRPGTAKIRPGPIWASVEVFVPVRSLKSIDSRGMPYSDRMDTIIHERLKAEKFPRIHYRLLGLALRGGTNVNNVVQYHLDSVGELAVAGVTNRIAMPLIVVPLAGNKLQVTGAAALKTTSFNVKLPFEDFVTTGTLNPGDNVIVTFTWMLSLRRSPGEKAQPEPETSTAAVAAEEIIPAGAIQFANLSLAQVLPIYREVAQAQVETEERVESVPALISLTNTEALTRTQLIGLLDEALLQQAGIVVTHPATNRVTMRLLR